MSKILEGEREKRQLRLKIRGEDEGIGAIGAGKARRFHLKIY